MRRLIIVAALLVSMWVPSRALAYDTSYQEYAINYWCSYYGVSCWLMMNVALCESRLNPDAYNPSGASGVFQFMPSTYEEFRERMNADPNDTSKMEYRSYWDPAAAAHVAAYMFYLGFYGRWSCYWIVMGGRA